MKDGQYIHSRYSEQCTTRRSQDIEKQTEHGLFSEQECLYSEQEKSERARKAI